MNVYNMDGQLKEELIEQFRAYLETAWIPDEPEKIIDQMDLFNELAGLKTEVRIESRQLKGALDDFRLAFTSLDTAHQDMSKMLNHIKQQERDAARAELKPVLLGLIELHDRVEAGLSGTMPKMSFFQRLFAGTNSSEKWLQGHLEGQKMTLGRVLDLLNQCGILPMDSIGKRFDPNCMKAVGFLSDPQRENGVVLRENRKGFWQGERNFRPAEVIVNKLEEKV
ncbi:MAG: nucleotide exchange factor GrpE [Desulfobulbaceae bacterium]|nr:nucleotide exchange factor GrpE [Desulfobulbaceae bacterium]